MHILDASTLDTSYLYHYQPYKIEWLEDLLFRNTIYLSNPRNFNDPWDFRAAFAVTSLDDPAIYERHVQWLDSLGRRSFPHLPEVEHARRRTRLCEDRAFLESIIRNVSEEFALAAFEKHRVYCMSARFDHPLMWSHYACGHKGICLEFDHYNDVFVRSIRVAYRDKYPPFDLTDGETEASLLPWHTKSDVWSYEEEFRVIGQEKHTNPPDGVLQTRDGRLKVPATALRSVIMGCSVELSSLQEIQMLVRQRIWPPVALKRMVRRPDRYELSIQDVA